MQQCPELIRFGLDVFGSTLVDAGTRYQRSQYVEVAI
jgi:hypothetical protein